MQSTKQVTWGMANNTNTTQNLLAVNAMAKPSRGIDSARAATPKCKKEV
jgi:hypothetical protein